MIPTLGTVRQGIDVAALKELAARKGPCVTIFIPDHHPGAQAGSRRALVRDMIHRAEALLQHNKALKAHAGDLLTPSAEFAESEAAASGGPGFAIFAAPRHCDIFQAPGIEGASVTVASHFALLPVVERVYTPQDFYVLGLSTKHLRLFRYRGGVCEDVPLPPQVPESVEAAGGFKAPDHDLENRSTAGVSTGSMKAVHFGTLSDREAANEYMRHFFGIAAHGLKETLKGAPLLLAGVHEEITMYRRVSRYAHILESEIAGNIESLTLQEIGRAAADAAREHYRKAGKKALAEFREMPDRARTLGGDPHQVLRAAAAGRVHTLCVREMSGVNGHMERELDTTHFGNEDLLNAVAVETIRHGGEVFTLAPGEMAASNPLAAILRY